MERSREEVVTAIKEPWPPTKLAEVPSGCVPCKVCGEMCMQAETVEPDWYGRGEVIRIFSMCDESFGDFENDDVRTEFGLVEEAVTEWNRMNRKESKDN